MSRELGGFRATSTTQCMAASYVTVTDARLICIHITNLTPEQAREIDGETPAQTRAIRKVLDPAMRRLSPGDHFFVGDAAAEITVLLEIAGKVLISHARTEILKAVAVIRNQERSLADLGQPCRLSPTRTADVSLLLVRTIRHRSGERTSSERCQARRNGSKHNEH